MYAHLESYLEYAAWSSTDDNGDSLEWASFSDAAKARMEKDLNDFVEYCEENHPKELEAYDTETDFQMPEKQFAHDFWLTRNGHGAGFWDRGLGEIGDVLAKAAKTFGECNLYVNNETLEIEVY
jgi:hypothetical protein